MNETYEHKRKPASPEYTAEAANKLKTIFYDTPDSFFVALGTIFANLQLSERQLVDIVRTATFTVRKTKVTVADIIGDREELWR